MIQTDKNDSKLEKNIVKEENVQEMSNEGRGMRGELNIIRGQIKQIKNNRLNALDS